MSAKATSAEAQTDEVEIEYGDQFRHTITGEVKTVHDARDGDEKVTWVEGGWDYRDDLVAAIRDNASLYEVESRGDDVFEGEGY